MWYFAFSKGKMEKRRFGVAVGAELTGRDSTDKTKLQVRMPAIEATEGVEKLCALCRI